MLATLLKKFVNYHKTCSITDIQNKSVTFARDREFLSYLKGTDKDIWLITYPKFEEQIRSYQSTYCSTVKVYYTDWPEYEFTLFHNHINKNKRGKKPYIGDRCKIHSTVIMDVDGLKLVYTPTGEKIQFKHTGYIMIGDDVDIGPQTIIHRGTMGITNIKSGCKIGAKNNIAHNCELGAGTVLAVGVILNGGVITGENCWFASGSIINHYIKICDNAIIGAGSVVTKDITEPGVYVGNPARFLKSAAERWNF